MDSTRINPKTSLKDRIIKLTISYLIFFLIYNFTGFYTKNLDNVNTFVFDFEKNIPFISWLIIPYMSSGIFFVYVFLISSHQKDLKLLFWRINFITIVSGIFFLLFPLHFTFEKPEIHNSFLAFFFRLLEKYDTIYNQAPSLHISYAYIFWTVIRQEIKSPFWKNILGIWLFLMGISTLFVYQHHLIDIISALILVAITLRIFQKKNKSIENKENQLHQKC
ncbi:phosphatase PAP2 family protein [Weeksellaceae bacterium TAE3-ERU29]|nr:phosphatase PAP2 family protein [Weeksellaceae bacterium TAE3-ERU29]